MNCLILPDKNMFDEVIKSIIKSSGGTLEKFKLEDFMEKINHSLTFIHTNRWLGVNIMKNPLDLAILQQIMFDKRPDTVIECGTSHGGSAYYMASLMDFLNIDGTVITIDRLILHQRPSHPKIKYIHSDCLKAKIPKLGGKTMVVLDCDHSAEHVYKELGKFSCLVTPDQYIIVEDTDHKQKGGGPAAAIKKFLNKNKNFVVDKEREIYGISSNVGGYLIRLT